MLHRLLPCLLTLLVAPVLHAQFDTTTIAGRVLTRRMVAMEQDPAMQQLEEAGALDFDSWNIAALNDSTVIELVRLMALGLEREESRSCPAAILSGDGNAILAVLLSGITDSLEAEQWGELIEGVVWSMATETPDGPMAPPDALEERMTGLLENLNEEETAILQSAAEKPGPAACMMMRLVFQDLTQTDPNTAGPLIRRLMTSDEEPDESEAE